MRLLLTDDDGTVIDHWDASDTDDRDILEAFAGLLHRGPTHDAIMAKIPFRAGKVGKYVARTGATTVGNRDQVPVSDRDRATHADQVGVTKGEQVVIVNGARKGAFGTVGWIGVAERGGGPRVGVDVSGGDRIFVDADNVMNALKWTKRFGRSAR